MDDLVKPEIVLERLKLGHAKELYDLTATNREYLKEWLPWLDYINSSEDTKTSISATIKEYSGGGAPNFAIVHGGRICGVAGFHKVDKQHGIGSIGYWLAQEYTGQGMKTKATEELLSIGFGEFNLNKIEIRCAEENVKSRAIPERLGFKYEATLRQCERLYSKYVNHAIYSILAVEYNA